MTATAIDTSASLKAVCPRKDLYEAVQTVGHAVSGRNALPILSHIMVQAEENYLRLIATDLELGISCRVNAQIQEGGRAHGSFPDAHGSAGQPVRQKRRRPVRR